MMPNVAALLEPMVKQMQFLLDEIRQRDEEIARLRKLLPQPGSHVRMTAAELRDYIKATPGQA